MSNIDSIFADREDIFLILDHFDFLTLPGWNGSGQENWQSHWETLLPNILRVNQDDWQTPRYENWAQRLSQEVAQCTRPVVLIAHSLGTSLVTRWAHDADTSLIRGAFLVAPSDRDNESEETSQFKTGFALMVLKKPPFSSKVLCSSNDPYVTIDRGRAFADAWGSDFIDIGPFGHIGESEKLGTWPVEVNHLKKFVDQLSAEL